MPLLLGCGYDVVIYSIWEEVHHGVTQTLITPLTKLLLFGLSASSQTIKTWLPWVLRGKGMVMFTKSSLVAQSPERMMVVRLCLGMSCIAIINLHNKPAYWGLKIFHMCSMTH